jgi:hypothetical protein
MEDSVPWQGGSRSDGERDNRACQGASWAQHQEAVRSDGRRLACARAMVVFLRKRWHVPAVVLKEG